MNSRTLSHIVLFVVLLLVQVLVCNHIVLFGVAVPFVFVYFIIHMPLNMSTGLLLTLSFLLGLGVDLCSDTAGMNALACTVVSMMKRSVFFSYVQKDDKSVTVIPTAASMGFGSYFRFVASMVLIYCLLLFSIEYLSFSDVKEILVKTLASTVLTTALIMAIDSLTSSKREKRL